MTYAATERAPLSLSAANVDYAALLLRVTMGIGFIANIASHFQPEDSASWQVHTRFGNDAATEARSGKGHRDENFPVASHLIHPRHRGPILDFYYFVRAGDDVADAAEGILLYPAVDEVMDEAVTIQGHRLRFVAVDLSLPSAELRKSLLDAVRGPAATSPG